MIILMGVSGSGKTTIGRQLAAQLKLPFFDADDFHSKANIEKMRSGQPLNDEDRYPWLDALVGKIKEWEADGGAVLACSALTEAYRERLASVPEMDWVYLYADFNVIQKRMEQRAHFMDPALLRSQFDTLEVPNYGLHIDATRGLDDIVSELTTKLRHE